MQTLWHIIRPNARTLRIWQVLVLVVIFGFWQLLSRDPQLAFFFGEPLAVLLRVLQWFTVGSGSLEISVGDHVLCTLHFPAEIYAHLLVTLTETLLEFFIGGGLFCSGRWVLIFCGRVTVCKKEFKDTNYSSTKSRSLPNVSSV